MEKYTREYYMRRLGMLCKERQPREDHWRDIVDLLFPSAGRFLHQIGNVGEKQKLGDRSKILDLTPEFSLNTMVAGMQSGITNPSRNWFKLGSPDKDRAKFTPIRTFLDNAQETMMNIFRGSNTYRGFLKSYKERGAFGTSCTFVNFDFENLIWSTPVTIGEYFIAENRKGIVDTVYREFEMTVIQMVEEFGLSKVSNQVKRDYDKNDYDKWYTVVHAVEPNTDQDRTKIDNTNMPYVSCYFEKGSGDDLRDKKLRESGFKVFPYLVPRWSTEGSMIYGEGPGSVALGDIKQLYDGAYNRARLEDEIADPALQGPASVMKDLEAMPGGRNAVPGNDPNSRITTLRDPNVTGINVIQESIQTRKEAIERAFYVDLFRMISSSDRRQITAREIDERSEEKLIALGPVLENDQGEEQGPLIDILFALGLEHGLFGPLPPDMEGMDITIEYLSIIAQAQKSIGAVSKDRLLGTVAAVTQMEPNARHKIDYNKMVDDYAEDLGVPAELIVGNEQVAFIVKKEQEALQAQQQAALIPEAANTAKTLSETNTTQRNALTDIAGSLAGV